MDYLTDAELVKRAHRDHAAFETLMRRHGPRVSALARSMVGESSAEDVLQEVFISVYKSLSGFRGDSEFSTWLHRIALNACYGKLKKTPIDSLEHYELSSSQNVQKNAERAQVRQLIEQGLQTLPLEQREAFALREFSGLEYDAIAELLRCQLGTVKSRISRARNSLREYLSARGIIP